MPHWARSLAPKAIIVGGVADIVATNIALIPVAVVVFLRDPALLDPEYVPTASFIAAMESDPAISTAALLLGSACSVFGGWVAARMAQRAALLNGAFSAYGCLLISVYGFVATPYAIPAWQYLAFPILAMALGALGGMLFERRRPAPPVPPVADPDAGSLPRGFGHRALLIANRLLLVAMTLLAGMFGLAIAVTPSEDGSHVTLAVVLALSLAAVLCYLVAARALTGGRRSHWAWHIAASVFTLIPSGLLALGLWLTSRTG